MSKNYILSAEQIIQIIPEVGGAIATDEIMIEGRKVGHMERYAPEQDGDTGWVFYGGGETREYLDNADNSSVYSLNTIANYDSEVISFLTYPPGTKVKRNDAGRLEVVDKSLPEPEVVFLSPVTAGTFHITSKWSIDVREHMLRRFDHGSLVIWKSGLSVYINCISCDSSREVEQKLNELVEGRSSDSTEPIEENSGGLHKFRCQLTEDGQKSINMFAGGLGELIIIYAYYDDDAVLMDIDGIWDSLKRT